MNSSIDYRRTTRPDGRGPMAHLRRTMGHWSLTSTLEPKGETLMIMAGLERSKVRTPYPNCSTSDCLVAPQVAAVFHIEKNSDRPPTGSCPWAHVLESSGSVLIAYNVLQSVVSFGDSAAVPCSLASSTQLKTMVSRRGYHVNGHGSLHPSVQEPQELVRSPHRTLAGSFDPLKRSHWCGCPTLRMRHPRGKNYRG
ncbi:hypothetical protein BDZ89DRAFT_616677 [Hymenopellis radicata]|nr:hypothetical protein BDZ89DRAFT_616677 [Hymenopellis radicata]